MDAPIPTKAIAGRGNSKAQYHPFPFLIPECNILDEEARVTVKFIGD
jgi:hypothetical protein